MARIVAITTVDNPYDPIKQYDEWLNFDMIELGYNTCAYLSRIAHTSDQFTDDENDAEIERAIDEIIEVDPFGLYKKVVSEEENDTEMT